MKTNSTIGDKSANFRRSYSLDRNEKPTETLEGEVEFAKDQSFFAKNIADVFSDEPFFGGPMEDVHKALANGDMDQAMQILRDQGFEDGEFTIESSDDGSYSFSTKKTMTSFSTNKIKK